MGKNRRSGNLRVSGRGVCTWIIMGVVLVLLIWFFMAFRVEHVEVLGSNRYEDQEIRDYVMRDPLMSNTMVAERFRSHIQVDDIPFIDSFTVERIDNHVLRVHVNEKRIVGYFIDEEKKLFFDDKGFIKEQTVYEVLPEKEQEPSEEEKTGGLEFHPAVQEVPQVVGLKSDHPVVGGRVTTWNLDVFNSLWGITRMVEKYDILPDAVLMDKNDDITLVYREGQIFCNLGKDDLLEEKVTKIATILPQLQDMTGILHLETYKKETKDIIFSKEEQGTLMEYAEKVEKQTYTDISQKMREEKGEAPKGS